MPADDQQRPEHPVTTWDFLEEFCALRTRVKELEADNKKIRNAIYRVFGRMGGPTEESYQEALEILFGERE